MVILTLMMLVRETDMAVADSFKVVDDTWSIPGALCGFRLESNAAGEIDLSDRATMGVESPDTVDGRYVSL